MQCNISEKFDEEVFIKQFIAKNNLFLLEKLLTINIFVLIKVSDAATRLGDSTVKSIYTPAFSLCKFLPRGIPCS